MLLAGVLLLASGIGYAALKHREAKRPQQKREEIAEKKEPAAKIPSSSDAAIEDLWRSINLTSDARREELFDKVLARFHEWVWNLPASSAYHHSEAGGLYRHSIETALSAARRVGEISFRYVDGRGDEDPVLAYQAGEVWRYAAFVWGLMHDIGKCAGFLVRSNSGKQWEPFVDGLKSFSDRNPDGITVEFISGRGHREHDALTVFLMARILPEESVRFLRRFGVLDDILKELANRHENALKSQNAKLFLTRIKTGDMASVQEDRTPKEQEPEEQAPVKPVEVPKAQPAPVTLAAPVAASSNNPAVAPKEQVKERNELPPTGSIADYTLEELANAIASGAIGTNTATSDVFIGNKFLCLVYPRGTEKLLNLVKKRYGQDPRIRNIRQHRELVHSLKNDRQVVYALPENDRWKLTLVADFGGESDKAAEMDCVLLFIERLPAKLRQAVQAAGKIPEGWTFRFFVEKTELDIPDFKGPEAPEYDGDEIVMRLAEAVKDGRLSSTGSRRQVYIKGPWTYFVCPVALDVVMGRDEVSKRWQLSAMLNALAKTGAVKTGANNKALLSILPSGVETPLRAVAICTNKLFPFEVLDELEAKGAPYLEELQEVQKR